MENNLLIPYGLARDIELLSQHVAATPTVAAKIGQPESLPVLMLETQAVGVRTGCGKPHLTPAASVRGANRRAGPAFSGRAFGPGTEVCQYLDCAPGQTCVV
jgi:hypothetical protein